MLSGEDIESVNSELRYITIELMKIAAQKKISFDEAALEFLKNATLLQKMIESSDGEASIHSNNSARSKLPRMQKPPKIKPGFQ